MSYKIKVENISKKFFISKKRLNLISHIRSKIAGDGYGNGNTFNLENINFEITNEDNMAIVGLNGSGKSTLLRIIAGLMKPKSGKVYLNGKAILLSGYGVGMENDLTVEENIYLYGAIYGLSNSSVREKIQDIIEWAELDNFLGANLRILSSGMKTRLAFSTTKHIDSDIYLLDEALTAGDRKFKKKCFDYFKEAISSGKNFVICTHDLAFAERFCNKTLWLNKGEQVEFGNTKEVLNKYIQFIKQ